MLAATVGALAATIARADGSRILLGLLAVGQLVGHLILSVVGHRHPAAAAPPAAAMLAAHLVAVVVGALLIAASDRLCRAISRAVRAAVRIVATPVAVAPVVCRRRADQPLRSALLLAASVSHRGPPVSLASLTDIPTTHRKPQSNEIHYRASSRALITAAATGAAMSVGLLAGAAPASAHVHADADNPTPGCYSVRHLQSAQRVRERAPLQRN